jgi:hypothetical protein
MHAAYFGLTAGKASDLQGAIDRVSASSAIGRDKIAGYTDQLYKMGLRGSNLEKVLEGVAIKASTQGEAQAQVFAQWGAGYALTGRSVDGLVDRVKNRLGGIARKQMEDTTVQALKQKEAFDAMFRDIHVDEYLHAAAQVNALLSQSTASGRALKSLLERIVQPLVDAATRAQPIMKRFFQGLIISALLVEIAYLKIRNAWWRTFGKPDTKGIDLTTAALWAGVAAGGALVVVLGLLAAVVASLAIPFAATLALIAAPFVGAWFAIKTLVSLITDTDWSGLASSIWQGLVKGLSSGLTAIATVADDLASSVSRAFTQALGIQSPSKVFMAYGLAIPQGVKLGVEQGTPDAQASVAGMVSLPNPPPTAAAPGAAAPAAGGASTTNASRSMSVTIQNLTVQASGPGAQAQAFDVKRALEQVLEGIAIQSGVPTL